MLTVPKVIAKYFIPSKALSSIKMSWVKPEKEEILFYFSKAGCSPILIMKVSF